MTHSKVEQYQASEQKIIAMLEGETDEIVKMATVSAVLNQEFETFYWTGFYRLINGDLVIGPYQGTPACMHIKIGRGVCGTAAQTLTTQVVPDVHAFPGHIACDALSNSEIVVPVLNQNDELIAVLDIDSTEFNTFDEVDQEWLEKIIKKVFTD